MQTESYQAQAIGCREEQQDAVAEQRLSPNLRLFVLADGMGGHIGGAKAACTVVQAIGGYLQNHPSADVAEALRQAVQHANGRLAEEAAAHPELYGMGTTVIALLLDEAAGRYTYISVGDSPLYLCRSGCLTRINANHAFAEDLKKMIAAGIISREEAERHPARHAVTSAITGGSIRHTDIGEGSLHSGDILLLASDGIQTLDDSAGGEMEALLAAQAGSPPSHTVQTLMAAVSGKNNPRQDNVSVILIRARSGVNAEPNRPVPPTKVLPDSRPTLVNRQADTAEVPPPSSPKRLLRLLSAGILLGIAAATAAFFWAQSQAKKPPAETSGIHSPKPAKK